MVIDLDVLVNQKVPEKNSKSSISLGSIQEILKEGTGEAAKAIDKSKKVTKKKINLNRLALAIMNKHKPGSVFDDDIKIFEEYKTEKKLLDIQDYTPV